MRLHSDIITITDVYAVTKDLPGVYVTASEHGSRSKARAFEVSLEGNGYLKNTGQYGAGDEYGATWDEWGVFIARLFEIDPNAFWGTAKHPVYANASEFHGMTADRFVSGQMPEDTHKRHTWDWNRGEATCKRCTAQKLIHF